jgi:hypothetical protein
MFFIKKFRVKTITFNYLKIKILNLIVLLVKLKISIIFAAAIGV